MDQSDDSVLDFGREEFDRERKHPAAVVFHLLLFHVGAVVAYLLCDWFGYSFIENLVVFVIFLALDFWIVKNITGDLLAGLRWWNYTDLEGKTVWVFQNQGLKYTAESHIFWCSLELCLILWIAFMFATIYTLNFKWIILALFGVYSNGVNFLGYKRCKWGHNDRESHDVRCSWLCRHPPDTADVSLFHMVLRMGAFIAYLSGWLKDGSSLNLVVIVTLLSMDFLTVKYISGSLFARLRWWEHPDLNGKSVLMFENRKGWKSTVASRMFLGSLKLRLFLWICFMFATIYTLNFKWIILALFGVFTNGVNFLAYNRCEFGRKCVTMTESFMTLQTVLSVCIMSYLGRSINLGFWRPFL